MLKHLRETDNEFRGADVELAKIFADQLGLARFRWVRANTWGRPIDEAKKHWTGIVGNVSYKFPTPLSNLKQVILSIYCP